MSERRVTGLEQALADEALGREIEQVLGVDPSPEFLVRVRMRLASEPVPSSTRWSLSWMTATAGVAATALVVAIYLGRTQPDRSDVPASAATSVVAADTSSAPRQTADSGASPRLGTGSPVAEQPARKRPAEARATIKGEVPRRAFPEVLLSAAETRGLETLLGRLQRGELTITVDEQAAEKVDEEEPADLVIAPIRIRPLDSATVTEGAEE